jgi:citrate synthase
MGRVEELVARVLGVAPELVRDDLEFRSVPEWDSLRHIDLMLALESEFNTQLDADRIVELTSVRAIRLFFEGDAKGPAEA